MLKHVTEPSEVRATLLSLLNTSGTLAGISLTLVGILNIGAQGIKLNTFADDVFLFSALGFVLVSYLIFFALRSIHSRQLKVWVSAIDVLFLLSLTLQLAAGFIAVYTLL